MRQRSYCRPVLGCSIVFGVRLRSRAPSNLALTMFILVTPLVITTSGVSIYERYAMLVFCFALHTFTLCKGGCAVSEWVRNLRIELCLHSINNSPSQKFASMPWLFATLGSHNVFCHVGNSTHHLQESWIIRLSGTTIQTITNTTENQCARIINCYCKQRKSSLSTTVVVKCTALCPCWKTWLWQLLRIAYKLKLFY